MSEPSSGSFVRKLAVLGITCSAAILGGQGPPSDVTPLQLIVASSAEQAEQLRTQVAGGADFAAVAREKSIDPTGRDGGHLGKLSVASLRPELRDALQGVRPGQVTAVVRIPTGYAILRVVPDSEAPPSVDASPSRTLAASATGATRDALPVAGLVEADLVFQSAPGKPEGWAEDPRQICRIRTDSMSAMLQRLEGIVSRSSSAADASGATPAEVFQARYALAQLYAYAGNLEKAVAWWREARKTAETDVPDARAMMTETLGVALLHKSEMDNGIYRTPGDMCLFPPRAARAVAQPAGAEDALGHLAAYLSDKPDDLEVKWLFNLASMLLGRYPKGVPERLLIPPAMFASSPDARIGRFVDVAPAAGLKVFSMAGGAVVDDFRGNGLLDVVTSSMDACEPLHVFRNNGDGTFTERSAQAGVSDQLGGLNLIQGDYNNDGCMDLLVLRGGWEFPMRKSLLRNNCDGTFTDVTKQSAVGFTATSTQTAAWADIDNDGFLDLFVGNEDGPNQLFRNKGDGTFEDIAVRAGVDAPIFTKAVVAADYDNDGYVDFYLSNFQGNNLLYHNNHNRTFTEVGRQAGVQAPWRSFAAWFFDYDNDGWPDLFVNSYYFSLEETMRSYLGMPHGGETSKLYRNLGDGTFRDVTAEAGLDKVWMPMAANFGDADGDGYLDMYLGMGNPSFATLLPHELLLNKGGKRFVNATAASGTGELHKGHGIAFADLDRDGDEDIVAEIGGAVPADRHALRLFENPGNRNDWINVRLIGVKSNRAAIGARISVAVESDADGARATRVLHRTVGSGGSFGANPMEQHIGLGPSARIASLDVWWPATNSRQHFANVPKNQFVEISEFAADYRRVARKPVTLGGAARGK
jgi:FG-GAP-like repeat/ASPIC and UnbV/PPIC-type PPIASE domain